MNNPFAKTGNAAPTETSRVERPGNSPAAYGFKVRTTRVKGKDFRVVDKHGRCRYDLLRAPLGRRADYPSRQTYRQALRNQAKR